jgi:N-acyl-D-amino-acid deacylase
MFARPAGPAGQECDGREKAVYYACGWRRRSVGARANNWHTGSLDGSSTLLVRRYDGKNWAVLFNARNTSDGQRLSDKIHPLVHKAANQVRRWPDTDQFLRLL